MFGWSKSDLRVRSIIVTVKTQKFLQNLDLLLNLWSQSQKCWQTQSSVCNTVWVGKIVYSLQYFLFCEPGSPVLWNPPESMCDLFSSDLLEWNGKIKRMYVFFSWIRWLKRNDSRGCIHLKQAYMVTLRAGPWRASALMCICTGFRGFHPDINEIKTPCSVTIGLQLKPAHGAFKKSNKF